MKFSPWFERQESWETNDTSGIVSMMAVGAKAQSSASDEPEITPFSLLDPMSTTRTHSLESVANDLLGESVVDHDVSASWRPVDDLG